MGPKGNGDGDDQAKSSDGKTTMAAQFGVSARAQTAAPVRVVFDLGRTHAVLGRTVVVAEPRIGHRLGGEDGNRFELIERLGGGGMAVVFLARDTVLERTVAIKFITHEVLG